MNKNDLELSHVENHHDELLLLDKKLDSIIKKHDRKLIDDLISFLEHYVVEHFGEEEQLMEKFDYKAKQVHIKEHIKIKRKVEMIRLLFDSSYSITHVIFKLRNLIDVLVVHIKNIDNKMIKEIK